MDQELRDLQARWTKTRDPLDGAVYLRALVRNGGMSPSQLEVAAYPAAMDTMTGGSTC